MSGLLVPQRFAKGAQTQRHKHVGRKGDLAVELHYGDFQTGRKHEAALFLYHVNRPRAGVFVPMGDLWAYAERDAMQELIPPLARQVFAHVTKQDCFRLLDAIYDYLEDLKNAPPDPALFKDRSLDAFLESCAQEGLEFFTEVGGKRTVH
ncbi:MAG TPA: hypothetical protein VFG73_02245 [Rhodanobacteraceae bacterium]|nr:hypothetical protein [Rhodanobacteraceae bacterium]